MSYVVVAYDTPSDRRRNEMRKRLAGFLFHSQKSVFEGKLRERDVAKLRRVLSQVVHRQEDAVRVFRLCESCAQRAESVAGRRPPTLPAALVVGGPGTS